LGNKEREPKSGGKLAPDFDSGFEGGVKATVYGTVPDSYEMLNLYANPWRF